MFGLKPPKIAAPKDPPTRSGRFEPEQCGSCAFYLDVVGQMVSPVCRRYPPSTFLIGLTPEQTPITNSHFPVTNVIMWCGEYKRRAS